MNRLKPHLFFSRRGLPEAARAFCLSFVIFLAGLSPAFADDSSSSGGASVGALFCNVATNLSPFIDVFNMVAYIMAGVFIVQGLLHLHHYHHNPTQHPHHKAFALLFAGTMLSALPAIIGTLISTFVGDGGAASTGGSSGVSSGGAVTSCSALVGGASGSSSTSSTGLDTMLTNFVNNINQPLQVLISVLAITMGVFFIIRGLLKASRYGTDPRAHSITHITANLVIGTLLAVLGQNVSLIMGSVFGSPTIMQFTDLQWSQLTAMGGDTTQFKAAIGAAFTLFQLVGLISFVRGWNILRNAIEGVGQATVPQGLTHIIGGVLAMNISGFMVALDATLGIHTVT